MYTAPATAASEAELETLYAAMRTEELLKIMAAEGLADGEDLRDEVEEFNAALFALELRFDIPYPEPAHSQLYREVMGEDPVPTHSGQAVPWWAVAALLLVVVLVRGPGPEGPAGPLPVVPPPTDRAGLAALDDSIVLQWAPPDDPEFVGVRGDVTWNDRLQTGFLRLSGMPVNDPALAQYQLWIVDPDRDENPVDGGVFDISVDRGEVIIPIRATLPVSEPAAFAITREKPGGVVVSEGPLRVVASAG